MASQSLNPRTDVFVIVGPTASGKTALALELARALRGEVVSCDSRQVYKRLSAGTDKPAGAWENGRYLVQAVPYHLVDLLEPTETFNAGDFVRLARPVMDGLAARGTPAVMAGGTGLYVKAYWEGLDPLPERDAAVRARLLAYAQAQGRPALHERLKKADPVAAAGIPPNNIQRVVRALEVFELTGKPISSLWTRGKEQPARSGPLQVGLRWPKELLDARIRARCARVFPAMIEEARALLENGCPADAPGLKVLGYPEAIACLQGRERTGRAVELYQTAVLQYAKRQRTWFGRQDVHWIDVERESDAAPERCAREILKWKE